MTERPAACLAVRAVAAELALGILEGDERGEALDHLARCPLCRTHVQELAEVVDRVLTVAPEAEPPPGFESAVIARIAGEKGRAGPARSTRRGVALVAAAVVLLAGLGIGLALGRDGGGGSGDLASAAMEAPEGARVGEVWRYGDEDAVLVVSVPAWSDLEPGPAGPRYALRLELDDGETVEVGDFGLGGGVSSWGIATELPGEDIEAVSVVDDRGRVWCTGRFA